MVITFDYTDAKSNEGLFATIVNDWKPLTFVTKKSILDFAPVQGAPLAMFLICYFTVAIVCDAILFLNIIKIL